MVKSTHGGPNRGQGRKPKPPQEKGELLKAWPPKWLSDLVRAEAQETEKSLSEIVIESLKERYLNNESQKTNAS